LYNREFPDKCIVPISQARIIQPTASWAHTTKNTALSGT